MTKDDIAGQLFDSKYGALSAWAKEEVDFAYDSFHAAKPLHSVTLNDHPAIASTELESLRKENYELWTEIEELRTELADLRAEFNK